jgi:putative hydrolase of HD superfamily
MVGRYTNGKEVGEMSLESSLRFMEELDKLKDTYRQCLVMSGKREENTAEHSYSLAMAAIVFERFANTKIDLFKAIKMALYHDIVEAYSGDTFHYNKEDTDKRAEETASLHDILSHLENEELVSEIIEIWNQFEDGKCAESIFLRGLDRFLPMYHNFKTNGHSWVKHGVSKEQALEKNAHIQDSSSEMWEFTQKMLEESRQKNWIN